MPARPVSTRTRAEDLAPPTRRERLRAWWHKWKDLIIAAVLLPTAVATFVIGLEVRAYSRDRASDAKIVRVIVVQQAKQQKATATAAKVNCQRSKQYGPAFADYFERVGVFTAKDAAEYRRTIPKVCPK